MKQIFPNKLRAGDMIRIIAPSLSFAIISPETRRIAKTKLLSLGLKLTFGEHIEEKNEFMSSSVSSRLEDLHEAFRNQEVAGIIAVIGGYNANQLLGGINWDLIKKNPKVFLGFSDNTILQTAFLAQSRLVTYYGPNYADFGQKKYFDYTLKYFKNCLMENKTYDIEASKYWTDDLWYLDQNKRKPIRNSGVSIIRPGEAQGIILGGNLCTLNLLQGTGYLPNLTGSIVFLEEDEAISVAVFDRNLQSLSQQPGFKAIRALLIGRFQKKSCINNDALKRIILSKSNLPKVPVACNLDFGHTNPKFTFPIGGMVKVRLSRQGPTITILKH